MRRDTLARVPTNVKLSSQNSILCFGEFMTLTAVDQPARPLPLIEAVKVTKHFGGTIALNEASFRGQRGSIHALVGENGAGKSTLVKVLAGVVIPDFGTVNINGNPVTIHSPADSSRFGIVSVFQELSLLPTLTVAENIFISNP